MLWLRTMTKTSVRAKHRGPPLSAVRTQDGSRERQTRPDKDLRLAISAKTGAGIERLLDVIADWPKSACLRESRLC